MSTEEEKKETNNDSNKIDYSNLDINELKNKNNFVKDLLLKIEILKKGVVDERLKTGAFKSKIEKLEEELNTKNNEIKKLTQEKLSLETKKIEEINTNNNSIDIQTENALSIAKEDIRKLNEQIIKLKLEQETATNKMNKTLDETEDLKKEYQTQIKLLSEANSSQLKEIKNLTSEKKKLEQDLEEAIKKLNEPKPFTPPPEMVRERESLLREREQLLRQKDLLISEKNHFEALLKDYKKAKEEAILQMEACLKKNGELVIENQNYKDTIHTNEVNASKMAQKLAEYKSNLLIMNLRNQVFHVKRVGLINHNELDIIFTKDNHGFYVMKIDEKNNSDVINILDVESVNQPDKKKNKIDISYMSKSKKYNISVLVNEYVIDLFIETYKNFYAEGMKVQNLING